MAQIFFHITNSPKQSINIISSSRRVGVKKHQSQGINNVAAVLCDDWDGEGDDEGEHGGETASSEVAAETAQVATASAGH